MPQPANPIYGTAAAPCPPAPVGNKNLIQYMVRLNDILVKLNTEKKKDTALDRLAVLKKEIDATNQRTCG